MKRRVPVLALLLVVSTGFSNARAAQEAALRMDQSVQSYVDAKQFMGSVLVAQDGKVLLSKGYGSANVEWNIPNSPSLTPMPIPDTQPQVTALVRTTLADLAASNPNLESFADRNDWTAEKSKDLSEFLKSLGVLKSIDLLERKESDGSRRYKYLAKFTEHTRLVDLTLERDGKISNLRLPPE
jgi:hypothetical protein